MKKVLIIVGSLQRAGAEHFCLNLCLHAPDNQFIFDYAIIENIDEYGSVIQEKGGRVFFIDSLKRSRGKQLLTLNRIMRDNHYDVLHTNVDVKNGLYVLFAKINRIPIRISHSHSTAIPKEENASNSSLIQRTFALVTKKLIRRYATHFFACSKEAGYNMYGKAFFESKGLVVNNGIEIKRFAFNQEKRDAVRSQYAINRNYVIGHIGRLHPQKNQEYLLKLLPEILKRRSDAVMIFLGDGPERERIENIIREKGLENKVLLLGSVENVSDFLSAFDCFVFPSLYEGLGIALIEAQVNGLPCIVSENIPQDGLVTDLIKVVPLDQDEEWINTIVGAERQGGEDYPNIVSQAGYDVDDAYASVYKAYKEG